MTRSHVGWSLVALGVLANPLIVGLLAADGGIESTRLRLTIVGFEVALVLMGVGVLRRWDRALVAGGASLRIGALGIVLVGSVAIAEVLVHLVMGPVDDWAPAPIYVGERASRPSANFVADPVVGWRMRPGVEFAWRIDGQAHSYRATSEGFRSTYTSDALPDDEVLVVSIGDSFTFGTGVAAHATFPALLDQSLEGVAVHNLALPGMGIDQMWMLLRHHALPLRPRVVVVAFIDHDWDRSLTAFRNVEGMAKPTFVRKGGALRPATAADTPSRARRWLERRSTLLGLGRAVDRAVGYRARLGTWWSINAAMLEAMAAEARAAGVEILFVRLPIRRGPRFRSLARHMEEVGARYVDLNVGAPDGLHFATDDHINAAGHAFVAGALVPEVGRLIGGARSEGKERIANREGEGRE